MPITSKFREELNRSHPEVLHSTLSGQPSDIYLLAPDDSQPALAETDPATPAWADDNALAGVDLNDPGEQHGYSLESVLGEEQRRTVDETSDRRHETEEVWDVTALQAVSDRPAGRTGTLALTAQEALDVLPGLLADAIAVLMRYSDNVLAESALKQQVLTALDQELASRHRHPAFHFPDDLQEQRSTVQVHGLPMDLNHLAQVVTAPAAAGDMIRELRQCLDPWMTGHDLADAQRTLRAAHLALNWVSRNGSLDITLRACLPTLQPQSELAALMPVPGRAEAEALLDRAAYGLGTPGAEPLVHACLTRVALGLLLVTSAGNPEVFSQPVRSVAS